MQKIPIEKAVELALEEHRNGHFQRAQQMYMAILQQDPGNVDAIHLLGVLAMQGGRPDKAVELISRAVKSRPGVPVFHYNLGDAFVASGRQHEAAQEYRTAVEINPDYVEAWNNLAHVLANAGNFEEAEQAARKAVDLAEDKSAPLNNLGNALRGLGRPADARAAYEQAIEARPHFPEALNNLGLVVAQLGNVGESRELYKKAIQQRPLFADAHNNLGVAHLRLHDRDAAAECFQAALQIQPVNPQANNNLGVALRDSGRPEEAITYYRRAIEQWPEFAEAYNNLATAQKDAGKLDEAITSARKAIGLNPLLADAHYNLASMLHLKNELDTGIESAREAIRLQPNFATAYSTLGYMLIERGDLEEAMQSLYTSIRLYPDPQTHANTLLAVNYHQKFSPEEVFQMHRDWAARYESAAEPRRRPHANDRDPNRRLRIGYVSPDFRMHSVFFFAEPFLANHDKSQFEVFCYGNVVRPDMATLRARVYADKYTEIVGMNFEEMAELFRRDQIDILVDLAGHTGNTSTPAFVYKPSPIQILGIGYPQTSGTDQIDYKITDALCDPPGMTESINSEKLLRLPRTFWCYRPPENAPEVSALPADSSGVVTFATVNNFAKVTPRVQEAWAKLLAAVPNSRLVLRASGTGSAIGAQRVIDRFASFGISSDRLELRGHCPFDEFLRGFSEIDIVLDPFPFNGGTTTCHNLWMGVPTISLEGLNQVSRMGLSILTNLGLPELVGKSVEDYIRIAAELAGDLPRLRELRRTMRQRMMDSPLRDEIGYTRELEVAYRRAWREWCSTIP